jgi:ComF family protein
MRGSVTQRIIMKKTKPRFHHFLLGRLANRLLPSTCALCGQYHADLLCEPCQQRYASNASVRCPRCAITLTTQRNACHSCTVRPPSYDASFCATDYAAPIDNLVRALKFNAQLPLAAIFAERIMGAVPNAAVSNAGLMVAVPLSSQRIAQRGFNQAHEIARHIARAWQLPLSTAICHRVRDTQPQSSLPVAERRGNMRGAFTLMRSHVVRGQHVLVVDDVMTTGETLESFAAMLKRYGAARVTNLVFARTPAR